MGKRGQQFGPRARSGPVAALLLAQVLAGSACSREGERVLIVVNQDSPVSLAIGARYARLRGVPDRNIVRLSLETPDPSLATDEHETISRDGYRTRVRDPIEAHLRQHELIDRIDFVATTKGVPLRVDGTSGKGSAGHLRDATRASVDSELMLLFTGTDGAPGAAPNPYFRSELPFREFRELHGEAAPRYLVARLTGTLSAGDSPNGVPASVERLLAAADDEPAAAATWLIDADAEREGPFAAANRMLLGAADATLRALAVDVVHDRAPSFAALDGERTKLLAYVSWGSNDRNHPGPPYYGQIGERVFPGRFTARSIAIDFVSTSARTFTSPPRYGQSLISDLLALGAAGAGGHVYEPTLTTVHRPHLLFARYAQGASAIEAYWSSVPTLGWMHTWVGDPLMRLDPAPASPSEDRDGDGVRDTEDNCSRMPNAAQRDTDSDDYGNACDADIDNDGIVSTSWRSIFPLGERGDVEWIGVTARSGRYDPHHDLNGDGRVDILDISLAQLGLYHGAGPSGRRPPH